MSNVVTTITESVKAINANADNLDTVLKDITIFDIIKYSLVC